MLSLWAYSPRVGQDGHVTEHIALFNQSIFLSPFLSLSPSTLTIIYFISGIYKCFSASKSTEYLYCEQQSRWLRPVGKPAPVNHIPSGRECHFSLYLDWQMCRKQYKTVKSKRIFLSLRVEKVELCSAGCSHPPIFHSLSFMIQHFLVKLSLKLLSAWNNGHLGTWMKQASTVT